MRVRSRRRCRFRFFLSTARKISRCWTLRFRPNISSRGRHPWIHIRPHPRCPQLHNTKTHMSWILLISTTLLRRFPPPQTQAVRWDTLRRSGKLNANRVSPLRNEWGANERGKNIRRQPTSTSTLRTLSSELGLVLMWNRAQIANQRPKKSGHSLSTPRFVASQALPVTFFRPHSFYIGALKPRYNTKHLNIIHMRSLT